MSRKDSTDAGYYNDLREIRAIAQADDHNPPGHAGALVIVAVAAAIAAISLYFALRKTTVAAIAPPLAGPVVTPTWSWNHSTATTDEGSPFLAPRALGPPVPTGIEAARAIGVPLAGPGMSSFGASHFAGRR